MVWGGYAIWFSVTHVRATYARVSGLMVNVSAKSDTRVQRILVSTGDKVVKGQPLVELDSADLAEEVNKVNAQLEAAKSAQTRAEQDLEMTIRQNSASEQQATAELAASEARLSQAMAEMEMQSQQQPDEVRNAAALVASAKADLKRLEQGPRPQEIEQARQEVNAAQARLDNATSALTRMEKLNKEGAVSTQQLEEAATNKQVAEASLKSAQEKLSLLQAGSRAEDLEQARQRVAAAEATLASAKTKVLQGQMLQQQVATRKAERQQADASINAAKSTRFSVTLKEQDVLAQRAAVQSAEAAVNQAMVRLSESSLVSPVNGIVIRGAGPTVHEGEFVSKGMPIVTLVSTDRDNPFWISGSVSELYAAQVKEGQRVIIRIEAFPKEEFEGKVTQVGGATEIQTGDVNASPWMLQQVPIKVAFDTKKLDVKPGMSCQLWIDVRK